MRAHLASWIVAVLIVAGAAAVAHAQDDELDALNRQVVELFQAGKYAQAAPLAEQALALTERRLGAEHPRVGARLSDLALLYRALGRYADAEPLYRRDLALTEKAFGADHLHVSAILINLAVVHDAQGRYAEAEPLFLRALAIRRQRHGDSHAETATVHNYLAGIYRSLGRPGDAEAEATRALAIREAALGAAHPEVASTLNNLALIRSDLGRDAEAEALYKRALAILEAAKGPNDPDLGPKLANLGTLYYRQGRFAEAEQAMQRALSLYEAALGPGHPDLTPSLNNLGEVYRAQARYVEAERHYKRAVDILEKAFGPEHPNAGTSLSNLAEVYRAQGRYADAELLARRALAIRERTFGAEHPLTTPAAMTLAAILGAQGRYADAEALLKRSVSILEKSLGPHAREVGTALNQMALLYRAQSRHADSEPLLQRALAIYEKVLASDDPDVGTILNNLAELYWARGQYAEAEPLYKRTLSIFEKAFGPDAQGVATILNNLAALHFAQEDWGQAVTYLRRSTTAITGRVRRAGDAIGRAPTGKAVSETSLDSLAFAVLVKAAHRLAGGGADAPALAREMFRTAQWALGTEAAASLAQMAARQAKGDGALARLVRERQDLLGEWQAKDKRLIAARTEPPARRNAATEAALSQGLAAIDARVAEIDRTLASDFPEYTALAAPEPLDVAEVQAHLRPDEAVVLFLVTREWKPTPEETYIWVVTSTDMRWARVELGSKALGEEVQALRCGLDASAWTGAWTGPRCAELTGLTYTEADHHAGRALPFDLARAHKLHRALFGEIADLVAGKHLLIVPSGPLTQLPFHALVSAAPDPALTGPAAMRAAAWLARSHAVSVLPSVSSLRALRRDAKASRGAKPYLGIGNPLLDGPDDRYAGLAKQAREKQACPGPVRQWVAGLLGTRGGVRQAPLRDGRVELAHLRTQAPLPETADELCAVARSLKVGAEGVRLGAGAGEADLKRRSDQNILAQYRILHFATHGALAGEIGGATEPGLILSPPQTATELDDGYLSASEIAGLKLDADWVILSACNTAAGGADSAEALSGLARAFFYAGARALLVSHWAVYSDATVKLVTAALAAMAADPARGRAEALRGSMLALIDKGEPHEAHPAYWAPFVVVGEGAPAR